MRYPIAIPVAVLAVLATSGPATAADAEREALARLAHEPRALAPLVDAAEAGADRPSGCVSLRLAAPRYPTGARRRARACGGRPGRAAALRPCAVTTGGNP